MTTVLAIDQGTSGTKCVVVDADGVVRALVERGIHPDYLPDGGVEQDPGELLDSVVTCATEAAATAGIPIDVVTLTNQGETVLAWDPATGEPLSRAVVWQDRRAEQVCASRSEHAGWVAQRTGLVLDPYFSAPKMTWLREHVTRDGVVTTSDAWIVHHLTGQIVTDASTAGRSLLVGLDTVAWDEELLRLFDLGEEPLARIVACDEVVGETSLLGPAVPVGGLVVDQQAALFAQRCLAEGEAKCTFGTGAFLLANGGRGAHRSSAGLASCVAWQVRGETTYCFDGQVYTAASGVRWLQELGLITSAADLDVVAGADSGGVLFVPALAGLAAPWWRPDARAAMVGMTLSSGRSEIVTAFLQGLACTVAELADLTGRDSGTPLTTLRVDGGLTRSRALMQAVADLAQVRVEVYPSAHATPLGAVAMARLALDPALTPADAVVPWHPSTTYEPIWPAERAREHRERWNAAAALTLALAREADA